MWNLKGGKNEGKLKNTEMKMLRRLCGKILKNKASNKKKCEMVGKRGSKSFCENRGTGAMV